MKGRNVCMMHGGKTPMAGASHPSFKTGRYSRALEGKDIAEKYAVLRDDPHLLALTEEIAVLVALQQQTLEALGTGGGARDMWDETRLLLNEARGALQIMDTAKAIAHINAIDAVAQGAIGDAKAWAEYTERAEAIRKLVDTERKYREGLGLYLPLERADAIMQVLLDCIRRVVPREYVAALHEELREARMPSLSAQQAGRDVSNVARRQ